MTTSPVTVTSAGLADVIAYVWFELGYPPRESLVLVGVETSLHRLGVIARADLPPAGERPRRFTARVRQLAAPLVRGGSGAVMVLICSSDPQWPAPQVVRGVRRELVRMGLQVLDVAGVRAGAGYRSLLCRDPGCCPPEGRPITEVLATRTAASQVLLGRVLGASEQDLIADVQFTGELDAAAAPELDDPAAERAMHWQRWSVLIEGSAGGPVEDAEPPAGPGRFGLALADPRLRDAVLLSALGAPAVFCEQVMREGHPAPETGGDGALLSALSGLPNHDRLLRAQRWLAAAACGTPAGQRAAVLSVLAVLAWFGGHGPRSRLLIGLALEDDPIYSLALLMQEVVRSCVPPPWVRRAGQAPPADQSEAVPDTPDG